MEQWGCSVCGYVYDSEVGDKGNGVHVRTEFEDLPEGWACPDCGADKENFEPIE